MTGLNGDIALRAQRVLIGIVGLAAVVALVRRRRASGRPVRLSLEFLIACFSLALVTLVAATIMLSVGAPGKHEARGALPCWAWRL